MASAPPLETEVDLEAPPPPFEDFEADTASAPAPPEGARVPTEILEEYTARISKIYIDRDLACKLPALLTRLHQKNTEAEVHFLYTKICEKYGIDPEPTYSIPQYGSTSTIDRMLTFFSPPKESDLHRPTKFQMSYVAKGDLCPLCLLPPEGPGVSPGKVERGNCGHMFHHRCIVNHPEIEPIAKMRCPLCRHPWSQPLVNEAGRDQDADIMKQLEDWQNMRKVIDTPPEEFWTSKMLCGPMDYEKNGGALNILLWLPAIVLSLTMLMITLPLVLVLFILAVCGMLCQMDQQEKRAYWSGRWGHHDRNDFGSLCCMIVFAVPILGAFCAIAEVGALLAWWIRYVWRLVTFRTSWKECYSETVGNLVGRWRQIYGGWRGI